MKRQRLDRLLVERGLVESREQARRLILAGAVSVDQRLQTKPGALVAGDAHITLKRPLQYVSRAGLKLARALEHFEINPEGLIVIDVGASTGGFTDCLLQHGAAHVYAVDVGYGQLAWKLRQDPRVTVMERTNARYLDSLPEPADMATFDVSFISLQLVIPPVLNLLKPTARIVALVKPQFEAGRGQVGRGGVVKDTSVHRQVLLDFARWARAQGLALLGLTPSPIRGPAGNVEFLSYLGRGQPDPGLDLEVQVDTCIEEAGRISEQHVES